MIEKPKKKPKRHRMTVECDITQKVKAIVHERDKGMCIIDGCGKRGDPNAHYIGRARGGLGIEENIISLCAEHHNEYDNGTGRYKAVLESEIEDYLKSKYPYWDRSKLIYNKFKDLDPRWNWGN